MKKFAILTISLLGFVFIFTHLSWPQRQKFLRFVRLEVTTGRRKKADTDAKIFLVISWKDSQEARGLTYKLPDQPGDDNERGKTTTYAFKIQDQIKLEDISAITLINGMDGSGPGWFVEQVTMFAKDSRRQQWRLVETRINQWLDTSGRNGPAEPLPLRISRTKGVQFPTSSPIVRGY